MSIIQLDLQNARGAREEYARLRQDLTAITESLKGVKSSGVLSGQGFVSIYQLLDGILQDLNRQKSNMLSLENALENILMIYASCETSIEEHMSVPAYNAVSAPVSTAQTVAVSPENAPEDSYLSALKALFKWADKLGISSQSGLAGSGLSYVDALYAFFSGDMKGLTGAQDWCRLGDKSIGLWTDFYDYLNKFYNGSGTLFSAANQTKVAGIGLAGSLIGLCGAAAGVADTIQNTDNMGTAGKIGHILGLGDEVTDVAGSAAKLGGLGKGKGLYTPLSKYLTIAKGYTAFASQGFLSYEKYMADGVWDMEDTAATGVDSSVAGLYAMVDSLTFGLISEDTTGVSAEEISESLKDFGKETGSRAGNYIKNDPGLYQAYQTSGTVGKVAITFYAAAKERWDAWFSHSEK